ncbi:EAL domain-containing protein [Anatilimnocola sp. NA78]|uniref:EAL domain-containing protein n=1 Tax=Anatilimnocola sp. NA78 TaxID=3415683 RepID=UPI003CE46B72
MRTKILLPEAKQAPYLERVGGTPGEPIVLEKFPFSLGRNESCDYQVPSTRVSREHASISKDGKHFRIKDLGSTNGTLVNGKKIAEALLTDGDLLTFADAEFCFRTPSSESARVTVTHVMDGGSSASHDSDANSEDRASRDFILAVRSLNEGLLHRGLRTRFQPVVELATGQPIGYEAIRRVENYSGDIPAGERVLQGVDCRLTERWHQLHRLLAAEQAAEATGANFLFVNLQPAEVGADGLPETLAQLQQRLSGKRLIAEIPHSAVVDIPFFRDFLSRLRELNVGVCYGGFSSGQNQVRAHEQFAPDYLQLAPALARGVDRSTQRQQQIKQLVEAAVAAGSKIIATGVHSENESQTCRELGCQLAQGDLYGRPQTMQWASLA